MNIVRKVGKVAGYLFAAVGASLFGSRPPKPPERPITIETFEEYLDKLVEICRPPSLSLAVVKGDETVYQKSLGLADGPNNIAATPETVYQWMSMTKMTTAVAVIQLHEQTALNIDDPVVKYLPFFRVQYPSDGGEEITIRQILNHSSGLANPPGMLGLIHVDGQPYPDQVELAQRLMAENKKLSFMPGTQGTYSNLGYTVLGAIIEIVTDRPHHEIAAEFIFRPLGMNNTNHLYTDSMRANAAVGSQPKGHVLSAMLPMAIDDPDALIRETVDGRMWFRRVSPDFSGAAGVNGPITDAIRFVTPFLNNGESDRSQILSPESVALMFNEGHITAKGGPASFYKGVKHGLGWWIWPDGDRQRVMHSGDGPGFSNIMMLYPREKLGIVVMGNEWAYGVAFRGTAIRDSIAYLASSIDWR